MAIFNEHFNNSIPLVVGKEDVISTRVASLERFISWK